MLKDKALILLFLVLSLLLILLSPRCDVLSLITLVIPGFTDILRTLLRLSVRNLTFEDFCDVEREEDGGAQDDGDKDYRVHLWN